VIDVLNEMEAEKVLRWIKLSINRQLPSVGKAYAVQIDPTQASLVSLRAIAGVNSIAMLSPPGEGLREFRIVARTVNGNVQCDFEGTLSKHPMLVVPKQSLARGHRIHESDLIMKPFEEEDVSSNHLRDIEMVIGRETRSNLRVGQPIRESDIGAPIEVHRGDLVELRVNGGGISVTTNAKALGDGAASDLVEVETMQPRKRVHARVVESGVVEIVTRAPRVR
jgi:flagella basal body P-ring formation protein FlgA